MLGNAEVEVSLSLGQVPSLGARQCPPAGAVDNPRPQETVREPLLWMSVVFNFPLLTGFGTTRIRMVSPTAALLYADRELLPSQKCRANGQGMIPLSSSSLALSWLVSHL